MKFIFCNVSNFLKCILLVCLLLIEIYTNNIWRISIIIYRLFIVHYSLFLYIYRGYHNRIDMNKK